MGQGTSWLHRLAQWIWLAAVVYVAVALTAIAAAWFLPVWEPGISGCYWTASAVPVAVCGAGVPAGSLVTAFLGFGAAFGALPSLFQRLPSLLYAVLTLLLYLPVLVCLWGAVGRWRKRNGRA